MTPREKILFEDQVFENLIAEFCLFIKALCPEAVIQVMRDTYEDEDANIAVYLTPGWSDEQCDALEERLSERSVDILLETGYCILAGVHEPSAP